jgi:hypothetical protein
MCEYVNRQIHVALSTSRSRLETWTSGSAPEFFIFSAHTSAHLAATIQP